MSIRLLGLSAVFPIIGLGLFPIHGQAPAPSLEELSPSLRDLIVQSLPNPLHEQSFNWGHKSPASHFRWRGQGLKVRPEVIKTEKNDGTWKKIKVVPRDLGKLVFKLSDLRHSGPEQMQFNAFLSFMAGVEYEHQVWESGLRLYAASTRARLRINLPMVWECTIRLEAGKSLLPDTVIRMRVVKAGMSYDQFVVEHIAGMGGSGAKLIGEAAHSIVKQIKPSLERDLIAKANAAIVKAGDTKEIRIGLGALFEAKKK